ncbi:MAG: hypothetical protein ACK4ZW_16995 [Blastomonas sp.]
MTRQRSPSYPGLPLNQAVDLVEKIHRTCRTNIISREDAAKEMGYSGLTGRSLKVLSGLLQFGLLEKAGKGDVKVTRRAVEILHGIDQADRDEAKMEAALAPQLFRDIHERFPEGIPPESAIRSFLIKQDFMDVAIGPAINAFLETYRWVEDIRESEIHGHGTDDAPDPSDEIQDAPMQLQPIAAAPTVSRLMMETSDLNKINMDIRGDQVLISGLLDLKGLRALEKKIVGLKALLAPDDDFDLYDGPADEDRDPRD